MYLNYTLEYDISGEALSALTAEVLRRIRLEIRQGMGGESVGTSIIRDPNLGLEMRVFEVAPWVMTWHDMFDLVELVQYCFVEKRVFYRFKAGV